MYVSDVCRKSASYLTLFVNCTPVFMTRGLSGCMGIQGCLSTTKALKKKKNRGDHVSEKRKKIQKIVTVTDGEESQRSKGPCPNDLQLLNVSRFSF